MSRLPRLVRVDRPPAAFASLFAAAAAAGVRIGWLELGAAEPPAGLEEVTALGAARAVAAGGTRTVMVKPRRGPAVLGDLVREHFAGCSAVLVRGDAAPTELALLVPEGAHALLAQLRK